MNTAMSQVRMSAEQLAYYRDPLRVEQMLVSVLRGIIPNHLIEDIAKADPFKRRSHQVKYLQEMAA